MQLPIVAPAPLVVAHADAFRDLFEHRCQFQHFQNDLTGLIVLDNKSLANITRCVIESADKTNLKDVDPVLLEDPDFQALHHQFRTKIDLGIALLEAAIQQKVPCGVLLFDRWYLAEELVSMARYRKKGWISLLKKNRNLETHSFVLKDVAGKPIPLVGPHIALEALVPLIPPTAYQAVTVGDTTSRNGRPTDSDANNV